MENEHYMDSTGVECKKLKAYLNGIAVVKKKDIEKTSRASSSSTAPATATAPAPSRGFFGWI
jgi:hypothetical protein